jgi:thioredoxin-related protein
MNKGRIGVIVILLLACTSVSFSQDLAKFNLYRPAENAEQALAKAVQQAKAEGKNVFVQIGGNWCIWCMRFNDFATKDAQIDSAMKANFVVYHLNYSKENKNEQLLEQLEFPQRFGFPVFVILNSEGKRLHTQNSEYLEQAKTYNKRLTIEFLANWGPAAVNPKQYKKG